MEKKAFAGNVLEEVLQKQVQVLVMKYVKIQVRKEDAVPRDTSPFQIIKMNAFPVLLELFLPLELSLSVRFVRRESTSQLLPLLLAYPARLEVARA